MSILPLNEIVKEQVTKVKFFSGTVLFLNSDILNKNEKLKKAIQDKYIYIFTSPELVNLEALYPLLTNPGFKKKLALIIIDKAYLIT